jgi:hypothetical protein
MVMDAIILNSRDNIIKACKGRSFKSNDEIRQAEHNIEKVQAEIFEGKAKLYDFCQVVDIWLHMVKQGVTR